MEKYEIQEMNDNLCSIISELTTLNHILCLIHNIKYCKVDELTWNLENDKKEETKKD